MPDADLVPELASNQRVSSLMVLLFVASAAAAQAPRRIPAVSHRRNAVAQLFHTERWKLISGGKTIQCQWIAVTIMFSAVVVSLIVSLVGAL